MIIEAGYNKAQTREDTLDGIGDHSWKQWWWWPPGREIIIFGFFSVTVHFYARNFHGASSTEDIVEKLRKNMSVIIDRLEVPERKKYARRKNSEGKFPLGDKYSAFWSSSEIQTLEILPEISILSVYVVYFPFPPSTRRSIFVYPKNDPTKQCPSVRAMNTGRTGAVFFTNRMNLSLFITYLTFNFEMKGMMRTHQSI